MNFIKTKLKDCIIIEPDIFSDPRGFFLETYNHKKYINTLNIESEFVQDNHSFSKKNVLRGLHYQKNKPQGKLVRVLSGEVYDVAVDLRHESRTFGEHVSVILTGENKKQLWVPPGFAHGFLVLSEEAHFEYKCTQYYDKHDEHCIIWNDPDLNIKWPSNNPVLSIKDLDGKNFKKLNKGLSK